jgi:hypothetical protein|tara:strand:- start:28 stop:780 length:753 start_codon:yes stop_codon:yes gene_type:complete
MSETLQNALENHLNTLHTYFNYYSKHILELITYYTNIDYLSWSFTNKRNQLNKPRGKDYYLYYAYTTIWKIVIIALFIILLLLVVFFIKDTCPNVQSENIYTRLIELLSCNDMIILIVMFSTITMSYIIGGYFRVIGMLGFFILSVFISVQPENIKKLTTLFTDIYKGIYDVIKHSKKNNIQLDISKKRSVPKSKSKQYKPTHKTKPSTDIKKENTTFFNRYINPYSQQAINMNPYYNKYNIQNQPFYKM